MKIVRPRSTRSDTKTTFKRPHVKKIHQKKTRSSPRGNSDKVQIRKIGPLCPVWGARTQQGAQIKSWRAWVHWVDNDWTCETMKSFNDYQREIIQTRIKKGTDIWPWPEGHSPKDNYRRSELKGMNMHKWQDPSQGSNWISIPQNERQDDDEDKDIPNETDSLFGIQAHGSVEDSTETADSEDSSEDDDNDEEEDEI